MPEASSNTITPRRRPEDAATVALLLLKASLGLEPGGAIVDTPKHPSLRGGAMAEVEQ